MLWPMQHQGLCSGGFAWAQAGRQANARNAQRTAEGQAAYEAQKQLCHLNVLLQSAKMQRCVAGVVREARVRVGPTLETRCRAVEQICRARFQRWSEWRSA